MEAAAPRRMEITTLTRCSRPGCCATYHPPADLRKAGTLCHKGLFGLMLRQKYPRERPGGQEDCARERPDHLLAPPLPSGLPLRTRGDPCMPGMVGRSGMCSWRHVRHIGSPLPSNTRVFTGKFWQLSRDIAAFPWAGACVPGA